MDKQTYEWLNKNELSYDIWEKKYQHNNETFDEWLDRVSNKNSELKQLILEKKFLFGGRVLTNKGTNDSGSYFNCYSSGFVDDDYKKIMETNTNLGLTYKAQGGQGLSLSKLRPKGTPIGARYTSDGIIPFMEIFNVTTEQTSQGGARKGALLISLDIRHKEAESFIKIKSEQGKIEKANLSLEIDDEFMEAVQKYYVSGETVILHEKREYSGHLIEYDITPIILYKLLVNTCYDWAEPACLFVNRFRNYNLMEFDNNYQIETCNPCGEQPLPKNFCCNLGSLNLNEFIDNPYTNQAKINYDEFGKSIRIAIRALDEIIDENKNNHALEEQKNNSLNYRNIGLGIMGYANCLMKLGIKYGSEKSKKITDEIFSFLFKEAIKASNQLAKELGTFPEYNSVLFDSKIIKKHFKKEEIEELKLNGIRNCSLISIAPTGSISNLLGVSGGCEPEFSLKYIRKTQSLNGEKEKYYDVFCNSLVEYQKINNTNNIPDYFISSSDINWKDRVDVQSIMQNHVDTAISSTVNLNEDTPINDVEKLYLYAWENGLKGITIYRKGCKREGILTERRKQKSDMQFDTIIPISRKKMGTTHGSTYCKKTACGTLYITLNRDGDGNLIECFVNTSKGGICTSNIGAVNRMVSLALRSGVKVNEIIDQLQGITCQACIKVKEVDGLSCPDILSRTLKEFSSQKNKITDRNAPKCPECGSEIMQSEGCVKCLNCGWSKC